MHKDFKYFYFFIFGLFIFNSLGCKAGKTERSRYLMKQGEITRCDSFTTRKFRWTQFVEYKFKVADETFTGVYPYKMDQKMLSISSFNISDSIKIAYREDDPSLNYMYKRKFKDWNFYTNVSQSSN